MQRTTTVGNRGSCRSALREAAITIVALSLGQSGGALAEGEEKSVNEEILEILKDDGKITDEKYVELMEKEAEEQKEDPKGYKVKYSNALKIQRNDGNVKFQLGGRIQADFASIWPTSGLNAAVPGGEGVGVEFRRARFYMSGELYKRVIFKAQYDFAGFDDDEGEPAFNDVYIGLTRLGPVGTVRFGHMKEPIGLQELTSSKYITFMERSLPTIFDSARNFGLTANNAHLDDRITWALGIFAPTNRRGEFFSDDTFFDATGRITGLPWYSEEGDKYLHLGVGMSFQYARDAKEEIQQRPESHLAKRYIDTGDFQRDSKTILDAELAWVHGPFSVQGEYLVSWINRPAAATAILMGGYAEASWFLTGEHRTYKKKWGVFGRVEPKRSFNPAEGGWGAWQIAARYSAVTLEDAGINGGKEQNVTVGLNWHLFSNTRLMLNYVWADVKDTGDADRSEDANGDPAGITNIAGTAHILQARAQIEF